MKLLQLITAFLLTILGIEPTRNGQKTEPQDGADTPEPEQEDLPEPETPKPEKITSRFHWIIDPGHGPATLGKRSPAMPDGYIFYEYEYNHDIARRICAQLDELQIDYTLTAELNEYLGDALKQRVVKANAVITPKPRRFVSIHANAGPLENGKIVWHPDIEGTETFIHPNYTQASRDMANCFNDRIAKLLQSTNRGIKTAEFYVLRKTVMPACLVEIDFFTNPEFVRISRTEKHRQAVADTFVGCILELEAFSV